jgi:hypothetical protein
MTIGRERSRPFAYTETIMKAAILTFIRAMFWGSAVGGGPFLLLTVPIAIAAVWSEPWMIWIAIYPIMVAGAFVVPASVLLGLPLTAWLAHRKAESATTYAITGLSLGALIPIAISLGLGDEGLGVGTLFLAVPGSVAGTTTGMIWGQWREDLANRAELPPEDA